MKRKILIIEDDRAYRELLAEVLSREFEIVTAGSAEDALRAVAADSFDLALVDVDLPGMSGYELCRSTQSAGSNAPLKIIFLSGQANVEDKLAGFSVGASDYIVKPVDKRELIARVRAQVHSRTPGQVASEALRIGPIQVHLPAQRASYVWNGLNVDLSLTPTEFKLLAYFVTHVDQVISRDRLMENVWSGAEVSGRNVDVTVSKLRAKLGPCGEMIRTIHGQGYRLAFVYK